MAVFGEPTTYSLTFVPPAPAPDSDKDGDGFGEPCDLCPETAKGAPVDADGCRLDLMGDFDGDVDLADWLKFQACTQGPGEPVEGGCKRGDFDGDGDVDLSDLIAFQKAFTGSR